MYTLTPSIFNITVLAWCSVYVCAYVYASLEPSTIHLFSSAAAILVSDYFSTLSSLTYLIIITESYRSADQIGGIQIRATWHVTLFIEVCQLIKKTKYKLQSFSFLYIS